ncbi:magnesium transporter [Christensenellaceae bacterium NSJ-63]|uniref:Magnesium transporter MgtE n=1 Tax=Guopingia tenuis TaxID=2763656 RepID=A0A926DJZ9_9FIRM|nr:magnesium transporter [Guopingia tenuis]MBC8538664.1 magnesium transporter [Guopingia tenuis]
MERQFADLMQLLEERRFAALRDALQEENEIDIADFLESLDAEEAAVVFRMLKKEMAAEVFSNLSADTQKVIVDSITDQEIVGIIEDLYVDDAVDALEELPANVVKRILKNAKPETRNLINQFLKYEENTAGSIMTAEFVDLKRGMTVAEAIAHIRRTGEDRETIYTCYVTGPSRVLEGVVTVKELLLSRDDQRIEEIMDDDVICVTTTEDREEVARTLAKYNLLSLPVVDQENRLVGIVTIDDAVEVMEQEATEDFEKMAAMSPSEKPYLKTGVFTMARKRFMWLLVLMVSGMITGGILGQYEAAFASMPLLVTFIPMLTDTGGNAGSQSSTLVIRGMALSEISTKDLFAVMWKEIRVSLIVGIGLGAVNFVRLILTYPGNEMVALTVTLALVATVLIAKTIGGALPILAKFLKADPAIMAAPLITTIVDALSLIIYFTIASHLLPI